MNALYLENQSIISIIDPHLDLGKAMMKSMLMFFGGCLGVKSASSN